MNQACSENQKTVVNQMTRETQYEYVNHMKNEIHFVNVNQQAHETHAWFVKSKISLKIVGFFCNIISLSSYN